MGGAASREEHIIRITATARGRRLAKALPEQLRGLIGDDEWERTATEVNKVCGAYYRVMLVLAISFMVAFFTYFGIAVATDPIMVTGIMGIYAVWMVGFFLATRDFHAKLERLTAQLNVEVFRGALMSISGRNNVVVTINRSLLQSNGNSPANNPTAFAPAYTSVSYPPPTAPVHCEATPGPVWQSHDAVTEAVAIPVGMDSGYAQAPAQKPHVHHDAPPPKAAAPAPGLGPMTTQMMTVQITVPPNVAPGSTVNVALGDGRVVAFTLPMGVVPGQMLQVNFPAS